jgi:aryl sulfotransferase
MEMDIQQAGRSVTNRHFDSNLWNDFTFRTGDVVIASYMKSGTTWLQQIVAQLIFEGREGIDIAALSPWLDHRIQGMHAKRTYEAQQHRRFIKTHSPADALPILPSVKYIFVGRDGRDVAWSLHHHYAHLDASVYDRLNSISEGKEPPLEPPPASVVDYFNHWLDGNGHPFWSFWDTVFSWWNIRHHSNVLLVHFSDLKRDRSQQIKKIASFLEIPIKKTAFANILRQTSFEHMKSHASLCAPFNGKVWRGGSQTFIHRGTNGRWKEALPVADSDRYETTATRHLGLPCSAWLAAGWQDAQDAA